MERGKITETKKGKQRLKPLMRWFENGAMSFKKEKEAS
jgi:hypothetical protein